MRLPKGKRLFFLIAGAAIASLALTGGIVFCTLSQESVVKELPRINKITYDNAYITSCQGKRVRFCYLGDEYEIKGNVAGACVGVADIVTVNDEIVNIRSKQADITGIVKSYDETSLEIEGYGKVQKLSYIPIYDLTAQQVEQRNYNMLIVGNTDLSFIVENNVIVAGLIKEKEMINSVRVLLKNGDSIFYNNVIINSDWTSFNAAEYFTSNEGAEATITCDSGLLEFGDKKYPGTMIVRRYNEGYVVINLVPIEEYLRYVLPSEMPLEFNYEALKAQAVCARTFVYSQMRNNEYARYGANIDDSTMYQVYNSSGAYDITDRAVADTRGEVITYKDEFITCYYFSTCGEKTKTLSVWGNEESPGYLHGVKSLDKSSPFSSWTARISLDKLTDSELGRLLSFEIGEELVAHFEQGNKVLNQENEIRRFLGPAVISMVLADGSQRQSLTMLPSAYFHVTSVEGRVFEISGHGFGHGIGMSQYGANEMAKEGKDYKSIICYYYKDVDIVQMED